MTKSVISGQYVFRLSFLLFLLLQLINLGAQKLDYETYHIGNDYPGNPVWVPHNIADIFVTPEGTVYTNVKWEENGANVTEINPDGTITRSMRVGNHGGGNAVSANATHIYFAGNKHRTGNDGIDRRDRSTLSEASNVHVDCGEQVYGLALTSDKVFAAVRDLNVIKVYTLDLQPLPDENITINSPEDLFFDDDGMLWVLLPSEKKITRINPETKGLIDELVLDSSVEPTDIAIDNQNRMFITNKSANEQIRIYKDITSNPTLEGTFGTQGGILSGTPGIYAPLKFDTPVGVGIDQDGNIIVGNRAGSGNGSTIIQKYTPEGTMLWDLKCVVWIDMMQPIPQNENIVYSSGEKIEIDYINQEWTLQALTLDKHQYPDDFRLTGDKHPGATWIRELYGQNFMFLTNMPGTQVSIYKFDGEIAVQAGQITEDNIWYDANGDGQKTSNEIQSQTTGTTRGFWVDINGDIWQASEKEGIYHYTLRGLDAHGALEYSLDGREEFPMPSPFTELRRIRFYPEMDNLMVINGFTVDSLAEINHHWKRAGKVFRAYENWDGTFNDYDWQIIPPYEDVAGGNGGDGNIQTFEVVDDYVFFAREGSSAAMGIARGTVEVYKKDGTYVGYMTPTEEMGNIGILDITEAMVVYRLSWGPYIIAIEDDGKSKFVVYQWCPTGDCIPSDMEVSLPPLSNDTTLYTYNNIVLEPHISSDTSTIEKVEYYANNRLLGTSVAHPYSFTLPDISLGTVEVQAKVIAGNGAYKYSNKIVATISNGDPEVAMIHPSPNTSYNIFDTVSISADAFDYDGTIDSVEFYTLTDYLGTSDTFPFQLQWEISNPGEHLLYAKAYDDSSKSSLSDTVKILAYGYRESDKPENTANGIIYEYYEGSWDMLPDFSEVMVKKKDTIANFLIGNAREDEFAFRFCGYVKVPEKGRYTFYTESDDGSKLYIGDRLIVDNDGTHGPQERSGAILLDSGLHKIQVTMFERSGGASLDVKYEGPGISKQLIPDTVLFRSLGTAPLAHISSPANDTLFNIRAVIPFKVSIDDEDNDVSQIEIYTGDYLLGQYADTAYILEVNSLAEGTHSITAKVYDLGGHVIVTEPCIITINAAPELSFVSPDDVSEFYQNDTLFIDLDVSDENLKEVNLYVNNSLKKSLTSEPWSYHLMNLDLGTYYLKAIAVDTYGLETESRIEIKVVNFPPVISLIQPANDTVFKAGDPITFKASVTDIDDDVYKVAFYNGNTQIGPDADASYETTVNNLPVGDHIIVAKAFDRGGAVSESGPVQIRITNSTGIDEDNLSDNIFIHPNPLNDGELTIHFNEIAKPEKSIQLSVLDITGRMVYTDVIKGGAKHTALPHHIFTGKGIYIIHVKTDDTLYVKRLMVQ